MSHKQPNILLIMADQFRADAMGCSGRWGRTPNLDRIAAGGVRFANCVTNTPVCIPARVTMATGRYPHNTGVWNNCRYDMPAETSTWMQAVRAAGYRTSLFGKTHLHHHSGDLRDREGLLHAYGLDDVDEIGGPRASVRCGSHMTARWQAKGLWQAYRDDYADRFAQPVQPARASALPLEEYADVYVGQTATQYLQRYDRDKPWMCWVSFGGPHEPWDAPEPYASMYDPAEMPPPVDAQGEATVMGKVFDALTEEHAMCLRANYAGKISCIDDQIGHLLAAIEARGEMDNTVIAFTSDHGEMNGDHRMLYKSTFYDGAVRVPMLVSTPETRLTAGCVCDSPVEWMDLGATLVELAGGETAHRQFARSMTPALADPSSEIRDAAFSEIAGKIMLLDRQWKAAVDEQGELFMLYDVAADPNEISNLAASADHAEVAAAMQRRIVRHVTAAQLCAP